MYMPNHSEPRSDKLHCPIVVRQRRDLRVTLSKTKRPLLNVCQSLWASVWKLHWPIVIERRSDLRVLGRYWSMSVSTVSNQMRSEYLWCIAAPLKITEAAKSCPFLLAYFRRSCRNHIKGTPRAWYAHFTKVKRKQLIQGHWISPDILVKQTSRANLLTCL